jgi:hypothetical protein
MAARDVQAVVYTTDENDDYVIGLSADVFAQDGVSTNPKVGGADYTGSPALPSIPNGVRPRGVYVTNGTRTKFVVCLENTSELYTGVETAIDLLELGSATPLTWTRHKPRPERLERSRKASG